MQLAGGEQSIFYKYDALRAEASAEDKGISDNILNHFERHNFMTDAPRLSRMPAGWVGSCNHCLIKRSARAFAIPCFVQLHWWHIRVVRQWSCLRDCRQSGPTHIRGSCSQGSAHECVRPCWCSSERVA